jgi:hypothetical protein
MRLEEIQVGSAAEKRVSRLKADAKVAKERARQMKSRADATAAQLDLKKAQQRLLQQRRSAVTTTIKPYH